MISNAIILLILFFSTGFADWGFYSHKKIHRTAVFTLPPEMIGFYKYHISYLTEKSVSPDMRRYIDPGEGPRHYIDLEFYGDSALHKIPKYYRDAVKIYTEDSLKAWGVVPWHVEKIRNYLTRAFVNQDARQILRLSVDLGHYISDANVPLHTTKNYNGQLTDQYGIHGFWESRLPELFSEEYYLFTGKATYIPDTQARIWSAIKQANQALDSVLRFEKELTDMYDPSRKYSFEERNGRSVKVYSQSFSEDYHRMLDGMVARQMRKAIKMVGDFWYTCWVDGGQPDLEELLDVEIKDSEKLEKNRKNDALREHG